MISGVSSTNALYQSSIKESAKRDDMLISKQGDKSKIEELKDLVATGNYKVDLQSLAKKMAEELL